MYLNKVMFLIMLSIFLFNLLLYGIVLDIVRIYCGGLLKYPYRYAIIKKEFNPISMQLVSLTILHTCIITLNVLLYIVYDDLYNKYYSIPLTVIVHLVMLILIINEIQKCISNTCQYKGKNK